MTHDEQMIMNLTTLDLDPMGVWRLSIFVGLFAILLFQFIRTFQWEYLSFYYLIGCCIVVLEFPHMRYNMVDIPFVANAGRTAIEALLILPFISNITVRQEKWLYRFFCLGAIAEILLIWFHGWGVMLMASFDSALLACFAPFAPWWIALPIVITALTHHGATAVLILAAQVFALALRDRFWRIVSLVGLVPATLFVSLRFHDLSLGYADRMASYIRFMTAWWNAGWVTRVLGAGPGSFTELSMLMSEFKGGLFIQMHSDVLQILFELGIVGFILVLITIGKAAKDSWDHPKNLAALFGLIAFCVPYHPLRFFPTMLLAAWIMKKALNRTH